MKKDKKQESCQDLKLKINSQEQVKDANNIMEVINTVLSIILIFSVLIAVAQYVFVVQENYYYIQTDERGEWQWMKGEEVLRLRKMQDQEKIILKNVSFPGLKSEQLE